jgi:hypothetical protein
MNVKLKGCGPKYAALLKHAGYNHTELLCGVTPLYLHKQLLTVNSKVGIVAKVPQLPTLELWVNEALSTPTGRIIPRKYFVKENLGRAFVKVQAGVVEDAALISLPGAEDIIGIHTIGGRGGRRGPDKKRSSGTQLPGRDKGKGPWIPKKKL